MPFAFLPSQTALAAAIVQSAVRRLDQAQSITVTKLQTTEEFPHDTRTRYWFQRGGYFRAEAAKVTDVGNPQQGWTYRLDNKTYQVRSPLAANFSLTPYLGLELLSGSLPIVGAVKKMVWHGHPSLRVELDGRKTMTKETKLFAFFDPKTHLPIGFSANLGSITQVVVFENLSINTKIPSKVFHFTPSKGWKQVTPSTGGWK